MVATPPSRPRRRSNSDHPGKSTYSGEIDYRFLTFQAGYRFSGSRLTSLLIKLPFPQRSGFLCCLMESHCQSHYMAMPIGSQTLDFLIINAYTPFYHHVKEVIVLNFSVTAPYAWNCLPVHIRTICQLSALNNNNNNNNDRLTAFDPGQPG